MTPKSLLRHKRCVSNLDDFTKNTSFHRVLPDRAYVDKYSLIRLKKDDQIKKVVICSGKIYFDLVDARENVKNDEVVFIRLEQIYPFPVKRLGRELKRYAKNADFYWCQEEPKNMGAWNTVKNYIDRTLEIINYSQKNVEYIGRRPSASTATGNLNKHLAQQKEILEKVVGKIN
jgi:2-oxoglutarate dehydrogenase E1 component